MATAAHIKEIVLSDYLSADRTIFLEAPSRDEALKSMHDTLQKEGSLPEGGAFLDALIKREEIVSTGIGMGVAIPHAKLPNIDDFFIAIGVSKGHGIEWDALDAVPVRLIFMIGGPTDRQDDYLKILSALTSLIRDEDRRKEMISSSRPQDIIALLK